ncbi:hypothetical protein NKH89_35065 [Mesorhizobium sp. M0923]|uniref:hypothetical protein n=1 Tax=Mesorhizobium sp. M0923 TaxID=2957028 RepID=UPI00333BAAD9
MILLPNCEPGSHIEKIGGTSISNAAAVLENVLVGGRKGSALYNRIFVVSAYNGMTDRLLEHKKTGEPGVYALFASASSKSAWVEAIAEAHLEMRRLNAEIFGDSSERRVADEFVNDRIEGVRGCL